MEGKVTDRPDFHRCLEVDGWYEFSPMSQTQLSHLWAMSLSDADREIIHATRDQHNRLWERLGDFYSKYQGGQDPAWMNYLEGNLSQYPEMILQHNLNQVYGRLKLMREDKQDPATYGDYYLQVRNPISVEGLVHLTMGGPMPIYNGGLLMVSIRHYDADCRRPGLPADVSALVSQIDEQGIRLTLANLHPMQTRRVIVQAGAFAEHEFTEARYQDDSGAETVVPIGGEYVEFVLGPGTVLEVSLGLKRYCRVPSYQLPWKNS